MRVAIKVRVFFSIDEEIYGCRIKSKEWRVKDRGGLSGVLGWTDGFFVGFPVFSSKGEICILVYCILCELWE